LFLFNFMNDDARNHEREDKHKMFRKLGLYDIKREKVTEVSENCNAKNFVIIT
jgi:hypothetical protein